MAIAHEVSYQAWYSEMGKAHYGGKDLPGVRSSQRNLMPDKEGPGKVSQPFCEG